MHIFDVRLGSFDLQVEVDIVHWPIPAKVNAEPEDCYEAEEGVLEWNILNVSAADMDGLDIDEFASAVQSPEFEELIWEAISQETIY